jgi:hypothetical protein
MKSNYTPSINIIRDAQKKMEYIVTENAEKSAIKIINDFNKGFHSFNIIGSYGTGKSSFLWAFNQTIRHEKQLFKLALPKGIKTVETINIVGDYHSLMDAFNSEFSIDNDFTSNQKLFDKIFQKYLDLGSDGLLVLTIDEFGKFLEFAANNNPEKEMYFIQQLAEFVNDPNRNILLLTTLHQGVDTYARKLNDNQKNEWRKVKGRFQEITFNEPVEQLLSLSSKYFVEQLGETKESNFSKSLIQLQEKHQLFSVKGDYFTKLKNQLYPLDIFSAYTLTLALQRYGQNERSLFSFLQASDSLGIHDNTRASKGFNIASVYDYLFNNFYQLLSTKANPDYANWNSVKYAIQRAEVIEDINIPLAENTLKTIGLLQIFASKGAKIDTSFLVNYLSNEYDKQAVEKTIELLEKKQIIKFYKFNLSFKLFEGTDLDIEDALVRAENQISEAVDVVPKLQTYFDFPIVIAKANSYKTGTPRLFEYVLSDQPVSTTPKGEIDGFINLIFNPKLDVKKIEEITKKEEQAIIYGFFKNSEKISAVLFDIEKTKQVLKNIQDDGDRVAIKALESILRNNSVLLNHYVLDALYSSNDVQWIYRGELIEIRNKKELNKKLSAICDDVYSQTPIIRNELFNKHTPSGAIASARKNYFNALVNNFGHYDLGFEQEKFPPEKTIYYTLLVENGIHIPTKTGYTLTRPLEGAAIYGIWKACEDFLSSSKNERKNISDLIQILTSAPYKLKQGVIDFWLPTFLFIRKGDYALYSEGKFKPYINEQELYLTTRVPENYAVKSFELNDLRLSFFNKYRDLLKQNESDTITINTFIESIRPILLTFKNLIDYAKKTERISNEAIQLREAIKFAQDPEKLFFEDFPVALGFNAHDLLKSEQNFDDYIYKFQNTLDEIQDAYKNLLNRIEIFIQTEIIGEKCDFETYKKRLSKRFSNLKEYQLLPRQKTFLQRINSPLNDRDSWLASISQVLVGKPLTSIEDKDENILQDNLAHIVKELDNISILENLNFDKNKEEVFKLDFTTQKDGLIPHLVRIPKGKLEKVQENIKIIQKELGKDKQMRIAILAKLLKEEFEND